MPTVDWLSATPLRLSCGSPLPAVPGLPSPLAPAVLSVVSHVLGGRQEVTA